MSQKKAYVSPQVVRVKLEPTQAVLSQCSTGQSDFRNSNIGGTCSDVVGHECKQSSHGGDPTANS